MSRTSPARPPCAQPRPHHPPGERSQRRVLRRRIERLERALERCRDQELASKLWQRLDTAQAELKGLNGKPGLRLIPGGVQWWRCSICGVIGPWTAGWLWLGQAEDRKTGRAVIERVLCADCAPVDAEVLDA